MSERKNRVVCFGEILWDILPGGTEPGGAPVNVAYHLLKHGLEPAVITSIGRDAEGSKLKELFNERGLDTSFFAVDDNHETGKVFGKPDADHNMRYEIVQPVAWDYIPCTTQYEALVRASKCFVYGSLAARNEISRTSLFQLLQVAEIKVLDINLRPPHFEKSVLLDLMQYADILKMNEEELALIAGFFTDSTVPADQMRILSDKLQLKVLIITLGARGALLLQDGKIYKHDGFKVTVADTVGSGDAFLAGFLSEWLEGTGAEEALDYASRLGAFIATQKGGCPVYDPALLSSFPDC